MTGNTLVDLFRDGIASPSAALATARKIQPPMTLEVYAFTGAVVPRCQITNGSLPAALFIGRIVVPIVLTVDDAGCIHRRSPHCSPHRMLEGTIMKKSTVVALALAAAGAAHADDPTIDTHGVASTRTRAEVQAELAQAKRDGSVRLWSISYNPLTMTRPAKTRNQVLKELEATQESGELRALGGEDSGSAYLAARVTRPAVSAPRVLAGTPRSAQ